MNDAITTITQPIPEIHSLYRHYKGGEYIVLGVGTHTETKEKMVVYASLSYGTVWTRPLEIWNQFVNVPNDDNPDRLIPRFTKIERRTK